MKCDFSELPSGSGGFMLCPSKELSINKSQKLKDVKNKYKK